MEVSLIDTIPMEQRSRMLELPESAETHEELYNGMPFKDAVEVGAAPKRERPTESSGRIRVLAWNAARCTNVGAAARFIGAARADVVLLTEMDRGMARTGQAHTPQELAGRLSFGYAFAVEFLELGLGDEREKVAFRGAQNEVGYHGAAILSPFRMTRSLRIPLEGTGGWFASSRGQRRVGCRMALTTLLEGGDGSRVLFCSVHLESESDSRERLRETEMLLDTIDAVYGKVPVVIGGDLNTFSIPRVDLDDPGRLARWLEEDPRRFAYPDAHEPLFGIAEQRGYRWRECNELGVATHGSMKIDWFLCRGVTVSEPRVLSSVDPDGRADLSDHDAISMTVEIGQIA